MANDKKDLEIKEFLEECGKAPQFSIAEFDETILKEADDITYRDLRILISKVGWLDNKEREKFKDLLVVENLTSDEIIRYTRIYPSTEKFNKIFVKKVT